MEEPLDTYEAPKQDKMISLIAWLIIASLLFYVIVFTFESFLRKSPSMAISSELSEAGFTQFEDLDEADSVMTTQANDALRNPFSEVVTEDVVVVTPSAEDETSSLPAEEEFFGEFSSTTQAELQEEVTPTLAPPPVVEIPVIAVQETPRPQPAIAIPKTVETPRPVSRPTQSILRMSKSFTNMREALQFMKQQGRELPGLQFEMASSGGNYQVLMPDNELTRQFMRKVLQAEEVDFEGLSPQELINLKQDSRRALGRQVTESFISPEEAVSQYRIVAKNRPYTIQVGSFLQRENAVQLRDKMIQTGYLGDIEEFRFRGKAQYRVLVGNYASRQEASKAAGDLSERFEVPVYVREAPAQ